MLILTLTLSPQITEFYAFLPREAVTKFLTQCSECRKSMKTTIVQEIDPIEHKTSENEDEKRRSLDISRREPPKNIENYLLLLKAFYENSFIPLSNARAHSSVKQSESFKENIFANQNDNNASCNQVKRDINNDELDNSIMKEPSGVNENDQVNNSNSSHANLPINSVNIANSPSIMPNNNSRDYRNNLRTSCQSATTLKTPEQQMVTSSSGEAEENGTSMNNKWNLQQQQKTIKREARLSEDEIDNDLAICKPTTRASSSRCNESGMCAPVPDDILFDYHNIVTSYHSNKFLCSNTAIVRPTPTTPNNHNHHLNMRQPSSREDDVKDYGEERCRSSEMRKSNKHSGDVKPITSTYLSMTRSMGLADEDALNMVSFFLVVTYK